MAVGLRAKGRGKLCPKRLDRLNTGLLATVLGIRTTRSELLNIYGFPAMYQVIGTFQWYIKISVCRNLISVKERNYSYSYNGKTVSGLETDKSMTQLQSMQTLYAKLAPLGLPKRYVRESGLPSWWDRKLEKNPAALLEGAGHIAERLHLDLASLLSDQQAVHFKGIPQPKFKYRQQHESDLPELVPQIASRIAELIAQSIVHPFVPLSTDVNQIRQRIVNRSGKVTLSSLLDYCWEHGIAVVHFNRYPERTRKIAGMIQWQLDRPIIVLSEGRTSPAWLAFTLAHELGHLALGHVTTGTLVENQNVTSNTDDSEESEANQFAVNLLVNGLDNCFQGRKFRKDYQLKTAVMEKIKASDPSVDSAVLVFNYAWYSEHYALANKVVKELENDVAGDKLINHCLENHIDWDGLSADHADHLEFVLRD